MRLFIALRFGKEIEHALLSAQDELRSYGIKGSYTNCMNLHLTLAFIGEYDDPQKVLDVLGRVDFRKFSLRLSGTAGAFGDLWWAGLEKQPELPVLASKVRRALSENSIPFDRKPFRPHITLLRRAAVPYGSDFSIKSLKLSKAAMTADSISLMLSSRENGKLIYTELGTVYAAD